MAASEGVGVSGTLITRGAGTAGNPVSTVVATLGAVAVVGLGSEPLNTFGSKPPVVGVVP
jgi:hypothetical protein